MAYGDGNERKARKKPAGKSGGVGKGYDAEFRGYINLNLSPEQKEGFEAWQASAAPMEALEAFVGDGVNLSIKVDPKSEGFLASATQRREESPNAGLVVTARGRAASVSLMRVLYCLTILAHTERWEATQPMADPDRW